ncbi:segregation and condensation protein A [Fibrobacter sp.]|uniref:segregation and condensation protein A n=1 Tax=Fibrobacter sp. TaxID=35828 RepID=UPI00388E99D0
MTEVEEQEEYEVRIGAFNGPMDLLVYLVQKKEVPLEQISIAEIADQFLKWVNEYEGTDLSKAGDFLYMASRLMALKVQELLPAEQRDPEMEAEYNEDREQLMKEMLEYQRFKQVASGLQEMESENFGTYSRGRLEKTQTDEETLADANIWQLFRAYQKSLKTKISETIHHIELDYVTIQDRQQAINNYLAVNGRALFEDLLDNDSHPIVAAVTFMAMLEMIKTDEIVFRQSELFGPIWIYRKKNNADYAEEMAHETVFFSKDPDVKPGLVEAIRNQAIARSKEQTVGDLAAVMREAVLWTERGRNVSEDDLNAMLEGREDLSEVQENPFAEMMKEDEATENAQAPAESAPAEGTQAPTEGTVPVIESAPETSAPVADTAATTTETVAEETSAPVAEETPMEENEEWIASPEARNDVSEESVDEALAEEPQPADNMTDEEFEAFMKKAQAFYDTQANENSDDDDEFPSIEVHSND